MVGNISVSGYELHRREIIDAESNINEIKFEELQTTADIHLLSHQKQG